MVKSTVSLSMSGCFFGFIDYRLSLFHPGEIDEFHDKLALCELLTGGEDFDYPRRFII